MKIIIQHNSMVPIYEQLVNQIKSLILEESLKENEPLPSVRVLAKEIKASALTVKKAYDLLEQVIKKAQQAGISKAELAELVAMILEEELG